MDVKENELKYKDNFLLLNNSHRFKYSSSQFKLFLAGFIEGEGSLCVSIKKQEHAKFGYLIDPEFFLYQHYSGMPILKAAKDMFGTGKIFKKSGSENVWVYSIVNRRTIKEKVVPYFIKYVLPFSCKYLFFSDFLTIIEKLSNNFHFELKGFLEILEIVYKLNPNSKGRKRKIELEVLKSNILRDYTPNDSK
jgi:hypothetical protein